MASWAPGIWGKPGAWEIAYPRGRLSGNFFPRAHPGMGREEPRPHHGGHGGHGSRCPHGREGGLCRSPRFSSQCRFPCKALQAFSCFASMQSIKTGRAGMSRKFLKRATVP